MLSGPMKRLGAWPRCITKALAPESPKSRWALSPLFSPTINHHANKLKISIIIVAVDCRGLAGTSKNLLHE